MKRSEIGIPVYCADVGSVAKGRFAWWRRLRSEGFGEENMESLVDHMARDIERGSKITLGLECPQFVPWRDEPQDLTRGREGEGNRAWSAGAGSGALATGLVQTAWILDKLHRRSHGVPAFLDWNDFTASESGLFLWESFVSGAAKGESHIDDAEAGADAFNAVIDNPAAANAIEPSSRTYSLIGAALLLTQWTTDLSVISQPCLVIKAE